MTVASSSAVRVDVCALRGGGSAVDRDPNGDGRPTFGCEGDRAVGKGQLLVQDAGVVSRWLERESRQDGLGEGHDHGIAGGIVGSPADRDHHLVEATAVGQRLSEEG